MSFLLILDTARTEDVSPPVQTPNPKFDELEILKLIPVIIEQMKNGVVTDSEKKTLSGIFGDLWPAMVDESTRKPDEEMSPVLKALLHSSEMRLSKREIRNEFQNDIYGNSVNLIPRPVEEDGPMRIQLSLNERLPPSQRLMRVAARLIQQTYREERMNTIRQKKKPNRNKNKTRKPKRLRKSKSRRRHLDLQQRIRRSINLINIDSTDNFEDSSEEEMMFGDSYDQFHQNDYDDPSILELFAVAERHRLRRQRDHDFNDVDDYEDIQIIPFELFGFIKDDYFEGDENDEFESDEIESNFDDDYYDDYYEDLLGF